MARHAIILSAGQGSRLLPLTQDQPKCLIDFSGRSLIEWQIRSRLRRMASSGSRSSPAFAATWWRSALARIQPRGVTIRTLFNPLYKVADNLGSCWIAREAMDGDFLILNGDTLVSPEIVGTLLGEARAPITVTVDVKPAYDARRHEGPSRGRSGCSPLASACRPRSAMRNRSECWRFVAPVSPRSADRSRR